MRIAPAIFSQMNSSGAPNVAIFECWDRFKRRWASQQLRRRGYFFKTVGEDGKIGIDLIFADFENYDSLCR
jgi:hypothetical protein